VKQAQVRYGQVQQAMVVKRLMHKFMQDHHLDVNTFQFRTFDEWERFLYGAGVYYFFLTYIQIN
jgi:hypothetical protein